MALSLRYGHGDLGWFDRLSRDEKAIVMAYDIETAEARNNG